VVRTLDTFSDSTKMDTAPQMCQLFLFYFKELSTFPAHHNDLLVPNIDINSL